MLYNPVLRIRIRDGQQIRIRVRDEQPGSYFREGLEKFFGLKYLNSMMRIRDGKNSDPGSVINISYPNHCYIQFFTKLEFQNTFENLILFTYESSRPIGVNLRSYTER
jgi:hypothetical protein